MTARAWLAVAVVAVVAGSSGAASGAGTPRCFGAAARDLLEPCHNRALRFVVRPRPSIAQITPNAACVRLKRFGPVHPCAFGVAARDAVATVALIGDSHASHWRAALHEAAVARGWRGISITNGVCPVSTILRPSHGSLHQCARWNRGVVRWLTRHRNVRAVVHAQISNSTQSSFAAQVSGYRRMWNSFPRTVRHIVAIRDNPWVTVATPGCVMRAHAHRRRPDLACALPRSSALRADALAVAARGSRAARVDLVDLTRFFCGPRRCYPVVGGALVHKDQHHLTRVFSTTLGPFLLRRLNRIVPAD